MNGLKLILDSFDLSEHNGEKYVVRALIFLDCPDWTQ